MTVSLSASNLVFFFLSNSNKASVLYIVINRSRAKEQGGISLPFSASDSVAVGGDGSSLSLAQAFKHAADWVN